MAGVLNNPFVGPRTFKEQDSHNFYGREREARELLSKVISEPLVIFYSESGAGKSSLINTRLIPGLRGEEFHILPVARVGGALPADISQVDNIFVFNLLSSLCDTGQEVTRLAEQTIPEFIKAERASRDALEQPWVLIIDQFEEILNSYLERWRDRDAFFRQLGQTMENDPYLWILLTMREDYVAGLRPYADNLPGKLGARFYMQRMKAEAAQEAVEKPAALAGRPFAPGVAQSLIDNLRQIRGQDGQMYPGEFIEPVQLQVVCYQLWENLADSEQTEITQKDLEELGDVDTALAQYYEQAIHSVLNQTTTSELLLRNWFERQLITEAETRGTVYQGSRNTAGLNNRAVQLLENRYLLRSEIRAGGTWYELVHDRFVPPIIKANHNWRLRQNPVVQAAEAWERSGRSPDNLLEGAPLKQSLKEINREKAEPLVRDFLDASEKAERLREQSHRRQRQLTIALSMVFVIAVIAALIALGERNNAKRQEKAAIENYRLAETRQVQAVANAQFAEEQRQIAVANADLAATRQGEAVAERSTAVYLAEVAVTSEARANVARQAAEQSAAQVAARSTRVSELLELTNSQATAQANLLATISAGTIVDEEAATRNAETLAQATAEAEIFATAAAAAEEELSISGTPLLIHGGENLLVTAGLDGTIRLWDVGNPDSPVLLSKLPKHGGQVLSVDINEDGSLLASSGNDSDVYIWDISNPRQPSPVKQLDEHSDPVFAVRFTPAGQPVLISAGAPIVYIWNPVGPSRVSQSFISSSRNFAGTLAVRPDGHRLATGVSDGNIRTWRLDAAGGDLFVSELSTDFENPPYLLRYSPNGNDLVAAGDESAILYWNLESDFSGSSALDTGGYRILDFQFAGDGTLLTAVLDNGTLWFWDITDPINPELIGEQGYYLGVVNSAVISRDGFTIAYADTDGNITVRRLADSPEQFLSSDQ